jgi:hypothetical protein
MNEGTFHTYIVPLTDTSGEDPPVVVWRGCLLCYGMIPSFILLRKEVNKNVLV